MCIFSIAVKELISRRSELEESFFIFRIFSLCAMGILYDRDMNGNCFSDSIKSMDVHVM